MTNHNIDNPAIVYPESYDSLCFTTKHGWLDSFKGDGKCLAQLVLAEHASKALKMTMFDAFAG